MSGGATNRPEGSGANLRTFIAIDLPTPILDALAATQQQMQAYFVAQNRGSALRWSPIRNLHLTLRFLGDTTPAQREQAAQQLAALAAAVAPFALHADLTSNGIGGFPNLRQPRVLWVGLGGALEKLADLQAQVEAVVQAAGFAPEEKGFSPHLTLARAARDVDRRTLQHMGQLAGEFAQSTLASVIEPDWGFAVDHLTFYRSELRSGGSHYTVLAEFPLTG